MPVVPQAVQGKPAVLTVQGVNLTRSSPVGSWSLSEAGPDSNSTFEFDVEYTAATNLDWTDGLSQHVSLVDSTNTRTLFRGNLVNTRLTHFQATGATIHCTCIGYGSWLDRIAVPKWTSKRANGSQITAEREMVQSVVTIAGVQGKFDAVAANITNGNTGMTDLVKVEGGSVRDVLQAIADAV